MKKSRKGFTLIELLIVIIVVGILSAMMALASANAVDAAGASAIMGNLRTMKTAALEMYVWEPEIASRTQIKVNDTDNVNGKTIKDTLGEYIGKKSDALNGDETGNYDIVGSSTSWYVIYQLGKKDSLGVKKKLAENAKKADLYYTTSITVGTSDCNFKNYYTDTNAKEAPQANGSCGFIALKVR